MGHSTKAHPKSVKAVALELFTAGKSSTQVGEITGLKPGCIKSWIKRESWTAARSQAKEYTLGETRRVVAEELARLSQRTRAALAQDVHGLAGIVGDEHATAARLARVEQRARIAQSLTQSAKTLHDWGNGQDEHPLINVAVISAGLDELRREREAADEGQVVDVGEAGEQGKSA